MAVVSALLSSNEDMPADQQICFSGEVGLSGEIRPVNRIEQRIAEAEKLGFKQILVSRHNLKGLKTDKWAIKVTGVAKVEEVFGILFG